MDVEMSSGCDQRRAPPTALQAAMAVHHLCDHRCNVEHLFGNTFRCASTGMVHICDGTCDKRIDWGRSQSICLLSRKVADLPQQQTGGLAERKREFCCSQQQQAKKACQDYQFSDTDSMVA